MSTSGITQTFIETKWKKIIGAAIINLEGFGTKSNKSSKAKEAKAKTATSFPGSLNMGTRLRDQSKQFRINQIELLVKPSLLRRRLGTSRNLPA